MSQNDGVEMFAPVEPDTARLICSQDDNTRDAPHCTVTAGSNNLDISLLFQGEIELEDDGMAIDRIEYYARDHCRSAAVYCAYVCSGGLLALLGRWLPHRKLKITHSRCDASSADRVLVFGADGQKTVAKLQSDAEVPPFFDYRHVRHYLRSSDSPAPAVYQTRQPIAAYHKESQRGLSDDEVRARQRLFGVNLVKVPVKPHLVLLVEEVLNPFYIFQVWSVTIWLLDEYVYYAMCVACISIVSALVSLVSTRRNLQRISAMAYHHAWVRVLRSSCVLTVSSDDLVPGDVVLLQPQDTVPADLILVSGSVIVDESMLTGESVPVVKTALPPPASSEREGQDDVFCPQRDKACAVLCGTKVVDVSPATAAPGQRGEDLVIGQGGQECAVAAIVIRTGYLTAKGSLVRSILFPKESSNDFFKDAVRFICVLAALASLGIIYQVPCAHECVRVVPCAVYRRVLASAHTDALAPRGGALSFPVCAQLFRGICLCILPSP